MNKQGLPTPELPLRRTGIGPAGNMAWGAHICLFYETTQDLTDVNVDYLRAGLEGGELCLWVCSDPLTPDDAIKQLRGSIPGLDAYLAGGRIEVISGYEWYLHGGAFDERRIIASWHAKADEAIARGFTGFRLSGNGFWLETNKWKEFWKYEAALDRFLEGQNIIALCTYPLNAARASDLIDATQTHSYSLARRHDRWDFLETPDVAEAHRQIRRLNRAIEILSKPFPGSDLLTPRERLVLAQIVKGASSKEAARDLGISPRTIEFHRANIMRKLDARNIADLLSRVL
jgi:DNA-binding CsgD family transcriptional regulator